MKRFFSTIQKSRILDPEMLKKTRIREPDYNGFVQALELKNRVTAWLKLKDILATDASIVTREQLVGTLKLLSVNNSVGPMMMIKDTLQRLHTVDIEDYNIIIASLAAQKEFNQIDSLINEMSSEGIEPNIDTFNTILRILFKIKEYTMGFEFLERMNLHGLVYTIHTFDILLSAYLEIRNYDKCLELEKAITLPYSSVTFLLLMKVYQHLNDFQKVQELFKRCEEQGLFDRYILSFMISFYSKTDLGRVEEMIGYMKKYDIEMDEAIKQTIVTYYIKLNDLEKAIEFAGSRMNDMTLQIVLKGCFSLNQPQKAIEMLQTNNPRLSGLSLFILLDGFQKLGMYDELCALFEVHKTRPDLPLQVLNVVMEASLDRYDLELCEKVFGMFKELKMEPNFVTYKVMLRMYLKTKNVDGCLEMLSIMKEEGIKVSVEQVVELVHATITTRKVPECVQTLTILKSMKTTKKMNLSNIIEPCRKEIERHLVEMDISFAQVIKDVFDILYPATKAKPTGTDGNTINRNTIPVPSEELLTKLMCAHAESKELLNVVKTWNSLLVHYPQPQPSSTFQLVKAATELGSERSVQAVLDLVLEKKLQLEKEGWMEILKGICKYTNCESVPRILVEMGDLLDHKVWTVIEENIQGYEKMTRVKAFVEEAAEQLFSLQTPTEDPIPSYSTTYLLAKSYFDVKEYQRASFVLENAQDPQSVFLRLYSRFLHIQSNQQLQDPTPQKIPKELKSLAEELGSIPQKDGFLYYLTGVVYLCLKKVKEAREALIQSVILYPCNWSAWLEISSQVDQPETVENILEQTQGTLASLCFKIYVLNELHQPPESVLPHINELLRTIPKNKFGHIQRAILYHNSRDFEESEVLFEQLQKNDPFLIESMDYYSNVLYVRRKYSKLCELAHRMSVNNRFRPETCACIGNYYSMKGEREKAIESFSRALKLDPNYSPAWTLLGHEFVDSCNPKAAIEVYRKAVEINPNDYRAWYGLGQAYDLLSLPSYSIYYHQRAIAIRYLNLTSPNDGRMWGALSASLEATGRLHEAINCLKRVMLSQDIIEPPEFGKCAQLYQKLNEMEPNVKYENNAAFYYRKYLIEHEKNADISQGEYCDDANLFLTRYYQDRGELDQVEKYKSHIFE